MSDSGSFISATHQIGALPVLLKLGRAAEGPALQRFELYSPSEAAPALVVEVAPSVSDLGAGRPRPFDGRMLPDGFVGRFGFFFVIRFRPEQPIPTAQVGIRRSPLLALRPFLDYEFHRAQEDIAKYIHEVVLTGLSQMRYPDRFVFVHGAAMADPAGRGVLLGGKGGVGKTSLALELGRSRGWGFISDDLVGLDPAGHLHLNANWPKIYAYNALGDPELQRLLLTDRSVPNRLHWALRKRNPARVRRSMAPDQLYPAGVVRKAPLQLALILERYDGDRIDTAPLELEEAARRHAQIIEAELDRLGTLVQRWTQTHPDSSVQWGAAAWTPHIARALATAQNVRVRIPDRMGAVEYRRSMPAVLDSLLG